MSDQGNVGNVNFSVGVGRVSAAEFEAAGKRASESFGKGFQQSRGGLFLPGGTSEVTKNLKGVEDQLSRIDKQIKGTRDRGELFASGDIQKDIQLLKNVEAQLQTLAKFKTRFVFGVDTEQLKTSLQATQQTLIKSIGDQRNAQSSLTQFEQSEFNKRLNTAQKYFSGIQNQFLKGAQTLAKLQTEATQFDASELAKRQQNFARYTNNVYNLFLKGAQAQVKAQEQLGLQLNSAITRSNPGLFAARQKEFDKLAASASGVTAASGKMTTAFSKLAQSGGVVGKFAGSLSGLFGKAETALDGFGLSVSDVSILLGAGFAGGIAGAIQVGIKLAEVLAHMAEAAVKFLFSAAQLGAEVQHLRSQIDATFGPASAQIREFGQTAAENFGLAEKEALTLAGQIGLLFQSFGVGAQASVELTEGLISAAAVFQRVTPGAGSFNDVLTILKGSLTGNVEALRNLGVAVNEVTIRNTAIAHGFSGFTDELDANAKALLAELFVLDQARLRLQAYGTLADSQATTQDKLAASFKNLKAKIGEDLAPLLLRVTEFGLKFVDFLERGIVSIRAFLVEHREFVDALKILAGLEFANLKNTFSFLGKVLDASLASIEPLVKAWVKLAQAIEFVIDILPGGTKELTDSEKAQKKAADAASDLAAKEREIAEAESIAEQKLRKLNRERANSIEGLLKQIDAHKKVAKAIQDAERAESDAERNLVRVRQAAARQMADAQRELVEAYIDRNRAIADANQQLNDAEISRNRSVFDAVQDLRDAQIEAAKAVFSAQERLDDAEEARRRAIFDGREKIQDAIESRRRAISDARRRLEETELKAQRSIRDAEERLAEERINIQERVAEAEKRIQDLRRQQAFDLVSSFRAVQDAQRKDDVQAERAARAQLQKAIRGDDIIDAQEKLNKEISDSQKKIAELERDLAEERIDAAHDIEDAQRSLRRVIEDSNDAVADAQRDFARAMSDANDAVGDAQRALQDTIEDSNKRIGDAQLKLQRAIIDGDAAIAKARLDLARTFEDTQKRIEDAQRRVAETERSTTEAISDAQRTLTEVRRKGREAVDEALEAQRRLIEQYGIEAQSIRELNMKLQEQRKLLISISSFADPFSNFGSPASGEIQFAKGGLYPAGVPRLTGEKGLELDIPGHSGNIVSNERILRALESLGKGGGGGNARIVAPNITIVQAGRDADELAFALSARIARDL